MRVLGQNHRKLINIQKFIASWAWVSGISGFRPQGPVPQNLKNANPELFFCTSTYRELYLDLSRIVPRLIENCTSTYRDRETSKMLTQNYFLIHIPTCFFIDETEQYFVSITKLYLWKNWSLYIVFIQD